MFSFLALITSLDAIALTSPALHNLDLFLAQPVQRIDQPVKLAIRGGDLRSQHSLFVRRAGGLACFVQRQHLLHQPHDVIVAGTIMAKEIQLFDEDS